LLEESFTGVTGWYLDGGTSLTETLADVSAAEASIPVGGRCASLAAQVKHVAFFLDVTVDSVLNPSLPPVDWTEIWRTTEAVDSEDWAAIQLELQAAYARLLDLIDHTPGWQTSEQYASAIAVVAHTAYHLGEIRQALCTLRS
jgi:hypothetical protein